MAEKEKKTLEVDSSTFYSHISTFSASLWGFLCSFLLDWCRIQPFPHVMEEPQYSFLAKYELVHIPANLAQSLKAFYLRKTAEEPIQACSSMLEGCCDGQFCSSRACILSGFRPISKWIPWTLPQVFNQYETARQGGITLLGSLCAFSSPAKSSGEMCAPKVPGRLGDTARHRTGAVLMP